MGSLNFSKIFSYREQVARSSAWGHHFLFLNLILSSVIGFVYLYAAPDTSTFLSFTYLLVSWLGQMCFLSCVVYLVLLFPLSFIGSFKIFRVLAVIIAILGDAALLFDVKLYLAAKVHVSVPVLHLMVKDFDFSTGLNYNFMYIAVPVVVLLQLVIARLSTRELYKTRHNYFPLIFCSIATLSFFASHSLSAWADASGYRGITAMRNVYPAHYPLTARSFLASHGFMPDTLTGHSTDGSIRYPLEELHVDDTAAVRENILTIFINGLSYADLNAEDTPNLITLKQSYQSFENHYLPYQDRMDNLFAAGYGLPVQYEEVLQDHHVYPVTLEEMYRSEYAVRVLESRQGSRIARIPQGTRSLSYGEGADDDEILQKAMNAMHDRGERRISLTLLLNSLTQTGLEPEQRRRILRDLDSKLYECLKSMHEDGSLYDTLIMITSSEGNPALRDPQAVFPRQMQHVPLILIWPDARARGVSIDELTSHFDFAATVGREVLGIANDSSEYSLGQSLDLRSPREYLITTRRSDLILIAPRSVSIYKSNGDAYVENDGKQKAISPNLEHLIGATRELNRFAN